MNITPRKSSSAVPRNPVMRTPQRCISRGKRTTPRGSLSSPCFNKKQASCDRFIPSRSKTNFETCSASLRSKKRISPHDDLDENDGVALQAEFQRQMKSALLDIPLEELSHDRENSQTRLLRFDSPPPITAPPPTNPNSLDHLHVLQRQAERQKGWTASDISLKKIPPMLPTAPIRILDAPMMDNDFYSNVLDWSANNILAIGLDRSVWLWNANNKEIQCLMTVSAEYDDRITSVKWCSRIDPKYIAIGTQSATVQIWDTEVSRLVRTLNGHDLKVSAIDWNKHILSAAGKQGIVIQHDVRSRRHIISHYWGHRLEVCGLKWNADGTTLASGSNDNRICLWDINKTASTIRNGIPEHAPRHCLDGHVAAVKALAWCPFRPSMLASGGGTADRTIKLWSAVNGSLMKSVQTHSQVCSLSWSQHKQELCSAHGYGYNSLILWNYPSMRVLQEFFGHESRILHMAQSPDGSTVATASVDQTLQFWNVFGKPPKVAELCSAGTLAGKNVIR